MDMDQSTKHKTSEDTHAPHILTADAELGTKGTDRRRLTFRLVSPRSGTGLSVIGSERRAQTHARIHPRKVVAHESSASAAPRSGVNSQKNKEKFMNVGSKTISREKKGGGDSSAHPLNG